MELKIIQGIPERNILIEIIQLHRLIFSEINEEQLLKKLNNKEDVVTGVAIENSQVIGFKIGYQRKPNHFYSWIGGVHPDYRKQGIASKLFILQQQYCKENNYKTIQTKTKNKWKNMLIMNIKNGFEIIGTYIDGEGEIKIILEKKL